MSEQPASASAPSEEYKAMMKSFLDLQVTVDAAIARKEDLEAKIKAPNTGASTKASLRADLNATVRTLNVDRMKLGRIKKQLVKFPEGTALVERLKEEKEHAAKEAVDTGKEEENIDKGQGKRPLPDDPAEEGAKKRCVGDKEKPGAQESLNPNPPVNGGSDSESDSETETVKKPRMADRWYKLTSEQRRRLLKKYTAAVQNLLRSKFSRLPPTVLRTWARREQTFFTELGFFNRFLAMWAFVKKGDSVMRCHYHEINDHSCKVNDIAAHEGKTKNSFKVTGVPFESITKPLFDPVSQPAAKGLKLDRRRSDYPNSSDEEDSTDARPVYRTIDDLYRLCRVRNGRRILHCGCDLEEALFGFFIWKKFVNIQSRSRTETEEPFEKPLDPRTRHYLYVIFNSFGLKVDDLYTYDENGKKRTQQDILSAIIRSIKAAFAPRIQEEQRVAEEEKRKASRSAPQYWEIDDSKERDMFNFDDDDEEAFKRMIADLD
ncbi:hypothetical protein CC2G_005017 [Coprinopsis cinerea AmutBmut pab1-1]|nr:hypothetical protein CC2G_005017 [Coprinopsis cinerea AmutBmut pab1-1]